MDSELSYSSFFNFLVVYQVNAWKRSLHSAVECVPISKISSPNVLVISAYVGMGLSANTQCALTLFLPAQVVKSPQPLFTR